MARWVIFLIFIVVLSCSRPETDQATDSDSQATPQVVPNATAQADDGAAAWPLDQWNPHAEDDDVILPGPCGTRFAFRRVDTPVAGDWMTDIRFRVGDSGAEPGDQPYAQFVRQAHIVGGLSDTDAADARYYLIGKYEVTAGQYAAVMSGSCPELGWEASLPHQKSSWFDAVTFTQKLTEWIWENSPDSLPKAGETTSFVRLPTEAEWEYAARGGREVNVEARNRRVFPMPDGRLSDYAMHAGSSSCQGEVQPIGIVLPNPLGLYDILGNVQEFVLDPFRPTSAEQRLHGQTGGALAKGGSCLTNAQALSTGMRNETLMYDGAGRANQSPFTGFRLLVAASALTGPRRIDAFEEGWTQSRDSRPVYDGLDPAETIRAIAESGLDTDTAERLRDAAAAFDGEIAARAAVEARSIRTALMTGAMLVRGYRADARLQTNLELLAAADPDRFAEDLAGAQDKVDKSRGIYAELLAQTAEDYDADIITAQAAIVAEELDDRYAPPTGGGLTLGQMAERFAEQAVQYKAESPNDMSPYFDALSED